MTTFATTANVQVNITQKYVRCKTAGNGGVIVTLATLSLCRDVAYFLRLCNTGVMAGCTVAIHDGWIVGKCAGECTVAIVDRVA